MMGALRFLKSLLALSVFLAGAALPLPAKTPVGGDLVVALGSAPATLDPFLATDANGIRISHQLIFETLLRLDDSLSIAPGLAQWRRISPTKYRFQVRKGHRFQNGASLDARDVAFTLRHFMAKGTGSPYGAGLREKISRIVVLSAQDFEITLNVPYASFLSDLILPVVSRGDKGRTESGSWLNGSGPYRLARRSVGEIVLERNPYARPRPGIARVVLKVIKDESTRLLKFRKGDIHLGINVLPLDKLAWFKRKPLARVYRLVEAPGLSFQYLGFNMRDPILSKPEVRQALAQAINVDLLITYRQKGHSVRATGLFPAGSPFADGSLRPHSYDPAKAARLLNQAGYPLKDGRRFSLVYKTSTDRSSINRARIIAGDLKKVGVIVEVRSLEWATFYEDIKKGNFQLYSLRWIGVSDPGFLFELLHSKKFPPAGRNRGRYVSAGMDALLEKARLEADPARRKRLYRLVSRRVHTDLPYLSLWHNNNVAVVHRALSGFLLHPSGGFEHLAAMTWKRP